MKSVSCIIVFFSCLFSISIVVAQNKVVVVPLGGAVGDAVPGDVVKGKTFSSRVGKGLTGTLERHPMGQSYANSIGMTFNLIPAGTFIMGSPDGVCPFWICQKAEPGREPDETTHQVTLSKSFYMQITEVTNKQWNAIIVAPGLGINPSLSHPGDNHYPVETVNWFEAAYFANRLSFVENRSPCYTLQGCGITVPGADMECTDVSISETCDGYRLPTEAQWEYAARAETYRAYANPVNFDLTNTEINAGFNSNLAAMGWYVWNSTNGGYEPGTKPVAQKQGNFWGLYDMHGNVWEWCRDWYDTYPAGPVTDPNGASSGSNRVVRGGNWSGYARYARSARRYSNSPGFGDDRLGFRLTLPSGQ